MYKLVLFYSLLSCVWAMSCLWVGLARGVRCGGALHRWRFCSGLPPGCSLLICGFWSARLAGGSVIPFCFRSLCGKICVSGPRQVAILRPAGSLLVRAAWHAVRRCAASALVVGLRRSGYPLRWVGVVPVCAWSLVFVCCLCAPVCWRRWGHPVRRSVAGCCTVPRSVEGAVCLRRPVFGGRSGRGRKMAKFA